jgi:hypothetical protein
LKAKPMHIPLPCGFAFISISLNPSIFISCHAEPIQHMTITISFMAFMLLNTTCGLIIIVCCDSSQLDKTLLETQILLWVIKFSVCFFGTHRKMSIILWVSKYTDRKIRKLIG